MLADDGAHLRTADDIDQQIDRINQAMNVRAASWTALASAALDEKALLERA